MPAWSQKVSWPFNFDEIQITQDQARAWLNIVKVMKAIGHLTHAVDQFLLLKQVLCCIFGEAHKGLVYIPCLDDDHLEDRKVHLLQLGSAVGKALCGKHVAPFKHLQWLVTAGREGDDGVGAGSLDVS